MNRAYCIKFHVKGKRFTVTGVLEAKGGAMMGVSMDDIVVTPITTYQPGYLLSALPRGKTRFSQSRFRQPALK